MEIGPIFRALLRNRTRFALIALEIALTLAVVVNCLNMIHNHRQLWRRSTGMDVDNLLVVTSEPFAPEFRDPAYVQSSFEQDLRHLRALPGVRAATAMHFVPLSGGGSIRGRRPAGSDRDEVFLPTYIVADQVVETLGLELVAGRDFVPEDFPPPDAGTDDEGNTPLANILITEDAARRLFPDGDALGKVVGEEGDDTIDTIVGIVRRMHSSWPLTSMAERVVLRPGRPATSRRVYYMVRTEPGKLESLFGAMETELLKVNPGRLVETQTLLEIKRRHYRDITAFSQLLGGVSVLLVAVTSLGIIGLTSFSVTQRTRQIGTRRALGASRPAVLRYFLVENWIVTSTGLLLGIVFSYGLNFTLAHFTDVPKVPWTLAGVCMLLLWLVGLLAALAPALRGSAVAPVVATRTV
jgi:putative ABC transport system permease protein